VQVGASGGSPFWILDFGFWIAARAPLADMALKTANRGGHQSRIQNPKSRIKLIELPVISKDETRKRKPDWLRVKLPIKTKGRTIVLKNDVTFRVNMTVTDSKTIQRKIEEPNIVTSGNLNYQFRPNISYIVNQKLSIQMYYERTINNPAVSNSFRRATTRFGLQVRFNLAQ